MTGAFPAFMTTSIVPSANRHRRTIIFSGVPPGPRRRLETTTDTVLLEGYRRVATGLAGQYPLDKADPEAPVSGDDHRRTTDLLPVHTQAFGGGVELPAQVHPTGC